MCNSKQFGHDLLLAAWDQSRKVLLIARSWLHLWLINSPCPQTSDSTFYVLLLRILWGEYYHIYCHNSKASIEAPHLFHMHFYKLLQEAEHHAAFHQYELKLLCAKGLLPVDFSVALRMLRKSFLHSEVTSRFNRNSNGHLLPTISHLCRRVVIPFLLTYFSIFECLLSSCLRTSSAYENILG